MIDRRWTARWIIPRYSSLASSLVVFSRGRGYGCNWLFDSFKVRESRRWNALGAGRSRAGWGWSGMSGCGWAVIVWSRSGGLGWGSWGARDSFGDEGTLAGKLMTCWLTQVPYRTRELGNMREDVFFFFFFFFLSFSFSLFWIIHDYDVSKVRQFLNQYLLIWNPSSTPLIPGCLGG